MKPKNEFLRRFVFLIVVCATLAAMGRVAPRALAQSQPAAAAPALIPFNKSGRWGFSDVHRNLVIAPQYESAELFKEGLAKVELHGKVGFIDRTGRVVIPLQYDEAHSFSEGLAEVSQNRKHGFIDKTGKIAIPLSYDDARIFLGGFAAVQRNKKWGFVDKTGREITELKYDEADFFTEGMASVKVGQSMDDSEKCGYINASGAEVIPMKYYACNDFSEGLAHVRLPDPSGAILDGFIDKTGAVAFPLSKTYYLTTDFQDGLLKLGNGYIDKTGKEVLSAAAYEDSGPFYEGLARVDKGGEYGFIDRTGKLVIPIQFDGSGWCLICDNFSGGLAGIMIHDKYGFIDKTGRQVIPPKYDSALQFENGFSYVQAVNGEGYLGPDGTEYFGP